MIQPVLLYRQVWMGTPSAESRSRKANTPSSIRMITGGCRNTNGVSLWGGTIITQFAQKSKTPKDLCSCIVRYSTYPIIYSWTISIAKVWTIARRICDRPPELRITTIRQNSRIKLSAQNIKVSPGRTAKSPSMRESASITSRYIPIISIVRFERPKLTTGRRGNISANSPRRTFRKTRVSFAGSFHF